MSRISLVQDIPAQTCWEYLHGNLSKAKEQKVYDIVSIVISNEKVKQFIREIAYRIGYTNSEFANSMSETTYKVKKQWCRNLIKKRLQKGAKMENLNAEQIKKALECCANVNCSLCDECPFVPKRDCYKGSLGCSDELHDVALALITSQEQRIKELAEDVERITKQCGEIITECDERDAERLKQVAELTEENAEVKANWQKLKDDYDNNDKEWREAYADSQSKWEKSYEKLELTLEGVMHFVDKWLEGAELEKDEVNRAITMREKTLNIVEKLTEENERLQNGKVSII